MLITKNMKITIDRDNAVLDQELFLFQNDRNIDIIFEIENLKFNFMELGSNNNSSPRYFSIKILKPNGEKIATNKTELTSDGKVKFSIDNTFIDSNDEIGIYKMQIQLFDDQDGKITIPYFEFTVLEPIFEEDYGLLSGQIDLTEIGTSKVAKENTESVIYELNSRANGLIKWNTGDLISANRMNLIHTNIDELWGKMNSLNATEIHTNNEEYPTLEDVLNKLLYVPIAINNFTSNTDTVIEKGRMVDTVIFRWNYNKEITEQKINETTINPNDRVFTYSDRFGTNKTFTLSASDSINTIQKNISFTFLNNIYWGVSDSLNFSENLIKRLDNKTLSNIKQRTITVLARELQYIYYAYPSSLGNVTFKVGGFEGGFEKVGYFNVVNSYGYSENYNLYKSVNYGLGSTTIEIF